MIAMPPVEALSAAVVIDVALHASKVGGGLRRRRFSGRLKLLFEPRLIIVHGFGKPEIPSDILAMAGCHFG
jgi:hypothetical protein